MKKHLSKNVYEAVQERLKYLFAEFDNVLVAFSGGKDSSVLFNLAYEYARKNKLLHKLAVYHLDYEAQYSMTSEFVEQTFARVKDIRRYWLCLPVSAQCSVNMTQPYWTPWDADDRELWAREMPKHDYVINEKNVPFKFKKGTPDYKVQDSFGMWFASQFGKTAVLIGLRTDESLNRFRALVSNKRVHIYKGKSYINGYGDGKTWKAYPIYDWSTSDIWVANARFDFDYNKLYDIFYQAGLTIDQMRVASPFNNCATESIKLYKVVEPRTWGKLIGRVNGVNFSGIYGGTLAMGWRSITRPRHHTWKSYCEFLLGTMDEATRRHYIRKFNTSIKFWKERGGAVSAETIEEMKGRVKGMRNLGAMSKKSPKEVIVFDEYPDDLDVSKFYEVPTYKRMCICIIKNDYFCRYMGFAPTKQERVHRDNALEMYGNL